ncbi:hypothetical protein QQ045_015017 [Rhodiola kirilowii]
MRKSSIRKMNRASKLTHFKNSLMLWKASRRIEQTNTGRKPVTKKRKAPAPVEKIVEAESSGRKKTATPMAKKPKTSEAKREVKGNVKGKNVQFDTGVVVRGVWFVSDKYADKWEVVQKRKNVAERILEADKFAAKEIVSLIKDIDLWTSVIMAKPFVASIVREVIVNLPKEFADFENESYGKVSVRGKEVFITPEAINDYYGVESREVSINEPNWHKISEVITARVRSR